MTAVVVTAAVIFEAATICIRDFVYYSVSYSLCCVLTSPTLLGAPWALHPFFNYVILNPADHRPFRFVLACSDGQTTHTSFVTGRCRENAKNLTPYSLVVSFRRVSFHTKTIGSLPSAFSPARPPCFNVLADVKKYTE
jgi:hypothetical protein